MKEYDFYVVHKQYIDDCEEFYDSYHTFTSYDKALTAYKDCARLYSNDSAYYVVLHKGEEDANTGEIVPVGDPIFSFDYEAEYERSLANSSNNMDAEYFSQTGDPWDV